VYNRSDGSPLGVQGDKGGGPVSESRKTVDQALYNRSIRSIRSYSLLRYMV
jgi:hypothetical protein